MDSPSCGPDFQSLVAVNRMLDFQERRMGKIKVTTRLRSPYELLAEGTFEGRALRLRLSPPTLVPLQRDKQVALEGSCLGREAALEKSQFRKLWLRGWGPHVLGYPGWAGYSLPKPKNLELPKETNLGGTVPPARRLQEGKPICNPYGEPTEVKERAAHYFHFYVREDDRPRPIPKFISQVVDSQKGSKRKRSKSSERKPMNWLPRLKYFANDFFLAAAGLLILKDFSKGDAMIEHVIAKAERVREETPSLAPHSKKPIVVSPNLPYLASRKRP
ncbi:hypothetical protein Cgig2_024307 [Carnegiea gigantea]|uniref:Uncharacterized protein n=1 Tax=Carnegiea gigantea TaxID=171969 RepID=A0A9Q1H0A5_9CARY|nr:hypothetical protein Cgig2_024307 [Carnegiea gigantea]